jgi:hypothetical protein
MEIPAWCPHQRARPGQEPAGLGLIRLSMECPKVTALSENPNFPVCTPVGISRILASCYLSSGLREKKFAMLLGSSRESWTVPPAWRAESLSAGVPPRGPGNQQHGPNNPAAESCMSTYRRLASALRAAAVSLARVARVAGCLLGLRFGLPRLHCSGSSFRHHRNQRRFVS